MANYTPQQRQSMDAMISGSFNAVGAPAPYLSAPTSVAEMYQGILPASRGPTPAQLAAIRDVSQVPNLAASSNRLTAGWPWQPGSETALAAIEGIAPTPQQQNPAVLSAMMANGGGMPPLPRPRPGWAPTSIDMAAINGQPGRTVTNRPGTPLTARALAGRPAPPPTIYGSSTGTPYAVGTRGVTGAGYIYQATPNGFVKVGKLPGSSASRYAAANSGPGSVAAMEAWHGGGSSNPQSGGPAVGGSYGGMT